MFQTENDWSSPAVLCLVEERGINMEMMEEFRQLGLSAWILAQLKEASTVLSIVVFCICFFSRIRSGILLTYTERMRLALSRSCRTFNLNQVRS
jgi:hypothetical protein